MHDLVERFFSAKKRKTLAKSGAAMKDGSFPIENEKDLRNAEKLSGHGKNPSAARAHIEKRAKALGLKTHLQQEGLEVFSANLREAIRDIVKLHEEDEGEGETDFSALPPDEREKAKAEAALAKAKATAHNSLKKALVSTGLGHVPEEQRSTIASKFSSVLGVPGKASELAKALGIKLGQKDQRHDIVAKIASHIRTNPNALVSFDHNKFLGHAPVSSDATAKNIEIAGATGKYGALSLASTPPPDPRLRPAGGGAIGEPQSATSALEGPRTQKQGRITSVGEKGTETISLTPDQIRSGQQKGVRHMIQLVTPKSLDRPVERQKGLDLPDFGEAPKPSTQKPALGSELSQAVDRATAGKTATQLYYDQKARDYEQRAAEGMAAGLRAAFQATADRKKSVADIKAATAAHEKERGITAPAPEPPEQFSGASATVTDLKALAQRLDDERKAKIRFPVEKIGKNDT